LAVLVAAIATAVGLSLAGTVAASAAEIHSAPTTTGAITIEGSTTSTANNPRIPLTMTGVVYTHGVFVTSNGPPNGADTLYFNRGNLRVYHMQLKPPAQSFNSRTCTYTYNDVGTFRPLSGTGVFLHVRGPGGVYDVFSWGVVPRTHGRHGQCNMNAAPIRAYSQFSATGALTVMDYDHRGE
jgi:hypothetical protein